RNNCVDVLLVRDLIGKYCIAPPTSRNPLEIRMRLRKPAECLLKCLERFQSIELHGIDRRPWKVNMRVLKPGDDHATLEVDNRCTCITQGENFFVRPNCQNLVAANCEGFCSRPRRIRSPNLSIDEDPIYMLTAWKRSHSNERD